MVDGFELAHRLQHIDEPSRLIDAELGLFFDIEAYDGYKASDHIRIHGDDGIRSLAEQGERDQSIWKTMLPRYTASVDAVLATIPGWAFPYMTYDMGWHCQMNNSIGIPFVEFKGNSRADRPYGFLLAMLAASVMIEASQQRHRELSNG